MPPRIRPLLHLSPRPSPSSPSAYQQRTLHTTPIHHNNRPKISPLSYLPRRLARTCPEYPYPPPQWYKQSRLGLYGGTTLQFGNNVSRESQNDTKTRRIWRPNIKVKHVHSRALGRKLRIRVSTRVLRTIDKVGGIDEYVLGDEVGRVKELGEMGWKLRWAVGNRTVMGLPTRAEGETAIESDGEGEGDTEGKQPEPDMEQERQRARRLLGRPTESFIEKAKDNLTAKYKKYKFIPDTGAMPSTVAKEADDEGDWAGYNDTELLPAVPQGAGSAHMEEGMPMEPQGGLLSRAKDVVMRPFRR